MKAVLLVGGFGTRLRPLTLNTPKSMVPIANRPQLDYVLALLARHGFDEVIFAVQYLAETFARHYGGRFGELRLTIVPEAEPMGTAGAVKNVAAHLTPGETFLVFNGDILTDLDLSSMLAFHRAQGSRCTISLTPVEDPSQYGVVDLDGERRILRFTEKPPREEATSDLINAGTYLLEYDLLEHIPAGEPYMFERGLFPHLLAIRTPMYGYPSDAYWLDIGTPAKYLQAQTDLLTGRNRSPLRPAGRETAPGVWQDDGVQVDPAAEIAGPVVLGAGCRVAAGARLVGPLVLGRNCRVGPGAVLEQAVLWDGVDVGPQAEIQGALIGHRVTLGQGVYAGAGAIVADDCRIEADNRLPPQLKVWPGTSLAPRSITF